MSQTIRVRDEDAKMIETICDETGLNRADAAHFLIRTEAGEDGQVRNVANRALEEYIGRLHPELGCEGDVTDEIRDGASLSSAEQLIAVSPDVTDPEG